jgi:hypothetical protein
MVASDNAEQMAKPTCTVDFAIFLFFIAKINYHCGEVW